MIIISDISDINDINIKFSNTNCSNDSIKNDN